MRGIPLGVALVALGLYLVGLGAAPYLDPPEGFHAEIAREMALRDIFWDSPRLEWAWVGPGRASVHLIAQPAGAGSTPILPIEGLTSDDWVMSASPRYVLKPDRYSSHSVILRWPGEGRAGGCTTSARRTVC